MQQHATILARLLTAACVAAACGSVAAADVTVAQATPVAQSADTAITSKVKAALMDDKRLATLQIDVSTTDGVVVLKGNLPSADTVQQAVQVAGAVPGVKTIRNELKVAS
ncbi:BON domain-containing protein [Aquabacterium sp.]|uniref:BON domain-containing protein n=1 Tax=Aquabacterium sp. TaxID=1872578 RepID=UPI002BA09231|nr:BON domain-containing protein [Aquabacterium sp.]HSW07277.1 BON domain-containing protein [Aquabacterium sp.]